jgi:hypothetical protein
VKAMREAARANLGLYTTFPFFQRLFRASGFGPEADQMEKGAGGPSLSDRILDAMCLTGPLTRCREQLAAFAAPVSTCRFASLRSASTARAA